MEKDSSHTHQNYRGRMAPVLRAPPMKVGFAIFFLLKLLTIVDLCNLEEKNREKHHL